VAPGDNEKRSLKHVAFLDALAAHGGGEDSSWRALTAGLIVLRLVDAWIEEGQHVVAADAWGMRAVRSAIEELDDTTPVRAILASVVNAVEQSSTVELHAPAPRLMAYAQVLEYDAKWPLAIDVYRTIIAHTHPVEDADIVTMAQLRLAFCLRSLGELTASAEAYRVAGEVASLAGDLVGVLRSRIGEATIAIAHGNMPRAETILDETIDRASEHGLADVHSKALHSRAEVAHLRGDYERSIRLFHRALENASPRDRDRILGDMAASFTKLGVYTAARDAYLVLAATAQERYVRWVAMLNLLEIAARTGMEPLFERYRRELSSESLPPALQTHFHLQVGQGYYCLGRAQLAVPALQRALESAQKHGFNQVLFEAEASLKEVTAAGGVQPPQQITKVPSAELSAIAQLLREMRDLMTTQ